MDILETLRLRAEWFLNEDYRKPGFPARLVRPLSAELVEAASVIEALKAENEKLVKELNENLQNTYGEVNV